MTQHKATGDVVFYKDDGTKLEPKQPLVAATTYYALIGGAEATWSSILWKWDAVIAITAITIETTNLGEPNAEGGTDFYAGVRIWDPAALGWWPEPAIPAIGVAAGTAGAQLQHNAGSAYRYRAKIVVGATGGKFRGRPHHKA